MKKHNVRINEKRTGSVTYVVEHLLCKHEGLSLNPGTEKKKKKKNGKNTGIQKLP
jgi:hypothetical protein